MSENVNAMADMVVEVGRIVHKLEEKLGEKIAQQGKDHRQDLHASVDKVTAGLDALRNEVHAMQLAQAEERQSLADIKAIGEALKTVGSNTARIESTETKHQQLSRLVWGILVTLGSAVIIGAIVKGIQAIMP